MSTVSIEFKVGEVWKVESRYGWAKYEITEVRREGKLYLGSGMLIEGESDKVAMGSPGMRNLCFDNSDEIWTRIAPRAGICGQCLEECPDEDYLCTKCRR